MIGSMTPYSCYMQQDYKFPRFLSSYLPQLTDPIYS